MSEQVLGSAEGSQPVAPQMEAFAAQPAAIEPQSPPVVEKQIPQSEVGKIAGASRKEGHDRGYEKGYQEALAKFQQQQMGIQAPTSAQSGAQAANPSPVPQNIEELIGKQIAERLQAERAEFFRQSEEKRRNEYVENLGAQLTPKIEAAKAKFEDFDSKLKELELDKLPDEKLTTVMGLINSVPNSGEVLYDIANNPQKLGILLSMHTPALAMKQVHAISQGLQNNQAAQDKAFPRNPLSVVEPSTVGKSTGELSGQAVTEAARQKYRF